MAQTGEIVNLAGRAASRLARLERRLAQSPDDRKLRIQISAARRRADHWQAVLLEVLGEIDTDVVDYRIIQQAENYSLANVTNSLSSFQSAVTAIYDVLQYGPKERARFSQASQEATRLDFGYYYPGSKGFILTVPNPRHLFGGQLSRVSETLLNFSGVRSSTAAIDTVRTLGLATVSELNKWVKANASWGNAVDLRWSEAVGGVRGQLISKDEFFVLQDVFASAEERELNPIEVSAVLVGINVDRRTFHLVVPDTEQSYMGRLADGFGVEPTTVPGRYVAKMQEFVVRKPVTGQVSRTYELVSLLFQPDGGAQGNAVLA